MLDDQEIKIQLAQYFNSIEGMLANPPRDLTPLSHAISYIIVYSGEMDLVEPLLRRTMDVIAKSNDARKHIEDIRVHAKKGGQLRPICDQALRFIQLSPQQQELEPII